MSKQYILIYEFAPLSVILYEDESSLSSFFAQPNINPKDTTVIKINNFFIWYPFLNRFYLNPKSGGLSIEQFEPHPPETHTVPLLWLSIALLVSATK